MKTILKAIDTISESIGSASRWIIVALMLVVFYEVIARYVFNAPTIWGYQTTIILSGSSFVLGWAYDQLHGKHVRVDIFYNRLGTRGRAIIDVVGFIVFFLPLFLALIKTSISWIFESKRLHEVMMETYWYPSALPFRIIIATGICLLFLQFVATFIRDLRLLIKGAGRD